MEIAPRFFSAMAHFATARQCSAFYARHPDLNAAAAPPGLPAKIEVLRPKLTKKPPAAVPAGLHRA